jgi:hypothetical protein
MPEITVKARVDRCISDAMEGHGWVYDEDTNELVPDPKVAGGEASISGLVAAVSGIIDALYVIAAEIDRQNAKPVNL